IKDKNIFSVDIDINDTLKVDLELNDFGINYIETVDKKDTNKTTKPKPKSICEVIPLDLPFIDAKLNGGYFNYNNHIVNYDNIKIDTNNTNLKFLLDYNNTNLTLDLSEDINLTIDSIQYSYINSLAGSNIIDNGSIEVYLEGTQCLFDSNIYLKDVEIKDAKILNKIFLIINSAPAAINPFLILPNAYRFAKDNFSLKSYKITNGDIALNINRETNIVDIKKLNAKGVHSDFYLKGKIDLYENNISSKMDVVFMKDYAAIINYIPLVRYVLLGDDKMFSYSVDINGDISNPKVSTHIMKETLLAPINIIKRILISPLLPFRDINMTDEQKQHHQQIVDEFIN
ncbi:MAG: AsmA-like C-terminal domain-containing protein, partial [Campylobacterota bacterium]|nr:AsmA-like C-terminal domain-containing protein [Campylobacterota bacterium]